MRILGLQNLTLLDYPGKTACTVFTGGCNLRCPFCHNAPLVVGKMEGEIAEEEFFAFLEKRKRILDGVAVTGGEPLLHPDAPEFLAKIKSLGYSVKLDTNGTFPDALETVIKEKLVDRIAMDIKNCPEKYGETVGRENFDIAPIERSIALIKESGIDYEFRTTVSATFHTEEDLLALGRWISPAKFYAIQAFKTTGELLGDNIVGYDENTLRNFVNMLKPYFETVVLRGV